jgi:hypothetical protein
MARAGRAGRVAENARLPKEYKVCYTFQPEKQVANAIRKILRAFF